MIASAKKNLNPLYGYYLVIFLDILGQKDAFQGINGVPSAGADLSPLRSALGNTIAFVEWFRNTFITLFTKYEAGTGLIDTIPEDKRELFQQMRRSHIKVQNLADSVIVFVPLYDGQKDSFCMAMNGIFGAFFAASSMMLLSFMKNHSVRGGIELDGGIEFFENEVYGPALNKAYRLERDVANYPRVVVGEGVIKFFHDLKQIPESSPFASNAKAMAGLCSSMISTDIDGQNVLDYLGQTFRERAESVKGTIFGHAYSFIQRELQKWTELKNDKLAGRYKLLDDYFRSRAPFWDDSSES